jgi:hypothetical protein
MAGAGDECLARRASAAKAGTESKPLIAAVNRCATQKQEQNGFFRQPVKPIPKWCRYRSAEALRHPKSSPRRSAIEIGYDYTDSVGGGLRHSVASGID